jgi:hypothetical protein
MRSSVAAFWLLAAASPALAAILEVNANACTVSPGGASAAPGKSKRRDVAGMEDADGKEPFPPLPTTTPLHAPGTPGSLERFPRPEPGSRAARHYNKVKAAQRPPAPVPIKEQQQHAAELELYARAAAAYGDPDVSGEEEEEAHDLEARQAGKPDDTPTILDAFKKCGKDGSILITEGTYNIRQVMNTSGLSNVNIDIYGKLVWSGDNLQYWQQRCFSVTYAGRCTAWLLSGDNIALRGHGKSMFDGNGQVWMNAAGGKGNMNGRPISLTIWRAKNVYLDGLTWRMAQFWHTFVAYSQNVTMTNMDMVSWNGNGTSSVNTDGTNTWNSKDVTIANWTVKCGDVGSLICRISLPSR